jgi:hypothetical protein
MLKNDFGKIQQMKCIVYSAMKGKDVMLGPKFDTLQKTNIEKTKASCETVTWNYMQCIVYHVTKRGHGKMLDGSRATGKKNRATYGVNFCTSYILDLWPI